MVTRLPAEIMRLDDYGMSVGQPADLVVLDNINRADAVRRPSLPLSVFKNGVMTVRRGGSELIGPS